MEDQTEETIKMFLDIGVKRVVVGTEAHRNPICLRKRRAALPGKRNRMIPGKGWLQ